MSDQSEWIRCGHALLRRSSITGAKWHNETLYVHHIGADKFMSLHGREAAALWEELIAGTIDLVTGELSEGGAR